MALEEVRLRHLSVLMLGNGCCFNQEPIACYCVLLYIEIVCHSYSRSFISLYFQFCRYHLKDVIVGKIYFLLVRIKIKHMEIAIIKRETTGSGPVNLFTENETIAKYEIMDGAPVKGMLIIWF